MAGIDKYTKLMLHGEKITSSTAKPVTFNGAAQISTAQRKVGLASALFNGTSSYLSIPDSNDFAFGTGDFTIEGWFKTSANGTHQCLYRQGTADDSNRIQCFLLNTNKLRFLSQTATVNDAFYVTTNAVITDTNWHHIAFVRNGSNFNIFVDGVAQALDITQAILTNSLPDVAANPTVGADPIDGYYWNGYIDEFRISKGIARYTTTFIPSTSGFTSDTFTSLLLHLEGTNAGTSTADSSGGDESSLFPSNIDKVITYNGGAVTTTGTAKFGGAALVFSATGDYIDTPASQDFTPGLGDFTYDFWMKTTASALQIMFGQADSGGSSLSHYGAINAVAGKFRWYANKDGVSGVWIDSTTTVNDNAWHHIACVIYNNKLYLFVDGALQAVPVSIGGALPNEPDRFSIGRIGAYNSNYYIGYIDEFRVSKGIARWTASFTPPTSPYTYEDTASVQSVDAFTKLLLHGNGTNNKISQPITLVGNAQISSNQAKFGNTSLLLDGSGDYITIPDSNSWNVGNNSFTFEGFFNFSVDQHARLFMQQTDGNNMFGAYYDSTNKRITFFSQVGGSDVLQYYVPFTPALNTWYHIAIERNVNIWNTFINGVAGTKILQFGSYNGTFGNYSGVLQIGGNSGGGTDMNGYIDEIRWSNIARYNSTNFTPTTVPFVSDSNTDLLLHFNGSAVDNSAGDESSAFGTNIDKVITYNGNVKTNTAQAKFGTSSLLFDGTTTCYISTPFSSDFAFGTGDFTIDFWCKLTPGFDASLFTTYASDNDTQRLIYISATRNIIFRRIASSIDEGNFICTLPFNLDDDTFHHVAFVRYGNLLKVFVDGIQVGLDISYTNAFGVSSGTTYIGGDFYSGTLPFANYSLHGYLDEYRVSKGIARWTSTFIPPTSPYGYISTTHATDIYTKLLLTGNKLNNVATLPITFVGNAKISTDVSKLGNASLSLDGSNSYISTPDNSVFTTGTQDFTWEFWTYLNSIPSSWSWISQGNSNLATPFFLIDSNNLNNSFRVYAENGVSAVMSYTGTFTWQPKTWYHIAVVRNGGNILAYINGVALSLTANTPINSSTNLPDYTGSVLMGARTRNVIDLFLPGYMEEIRYSKGIARYTSNFTPSTTQFSSDRYTGLLLHLNGINNSTSTADSSGGDESSIYATCVDKTVTYNGSAKIDNSQSVFGGTSIFFNGGTTTDYLTIPDSPDFDFGSNNWTIDFWFRTTDVSRMSSVNEWIFCKETDANNYFRMGWRDGGTTLWFYESQNGPHIDVRSANFNLQNNTWYHLAIVRKGLLNTDYLIFLNGVLYPLSFTDITTTSFTHKTGQAVIGVRGDNLTSNALLGWLQNFRISNGIARWTDNFTPPTAPYANISNTTAGIDSNTKLLLRNDKLSTDIAHPVSFLGTGQLSTAQSKFGASSIQVASGGNVARITDHANFTLGSNDFTIELWARMTSGTTGTLISQYAYNVNDAAWLIYVNGSTIQFSYSTDGTASTNVDKLVNLDSSLSTNTWYHFAVVRNGNNLYFFKNGVQQGATQSLTISVRDSNQPLVIGGDQSTGVGDAWNGFVDEVRISRVARYTSNFTPATSQFSSDKDTIFLCHCDGTNGSTTVADVSGGDESSIYTGNVDKVVTYSGNAQATTNLSVFGSSSLIFDGSGDYVQAASHADFNFGSGDFTIDFWARLSSFSGYNVMFDMRPGASGLYPTIYTDITTGVLYYYTNNANRITGPALIANQWYHIAVVKASGITTLYLNGQPVGNPYFDSNTYLQAAITVGAESLTLGTNCVNGYIDEVRVTKGLARWTNAFTPPTNEYQQYIAPVVPGVGRRRRPVFIS